MKIPFAFFLLVSGGFAQIEFTEHNICDDMNGNACFVYAVDLDQDGDVDVLGAERHDSMRWFENNGEEEFEEHVLTNTYNGGYCIIAHDLDQDGDLDILGTARYGGNVTWWENDGDEDFTEHTIDSEHGAHSIHVADLDGDNDIDVIAGAWYTNSINWWENDGEQDTWTQHAIVTNNTPSFSYQTADMDGDGDLDVFGASQDNDELAWFENDGDGDFTENIISDSLDGAWWGYGVDMDDDGDLDVVGAGLYSGVVWFENDGNLDFTEHSVSEDDSLRSRIAHPVDIDWDGDLDIVGQGAHSMIWWENDGNVDFTEHVVADSFMGSHGAHYADVDGDFDIDILGSSYQGGEITWWENDLNPEPNASFEGIVSDAATGDPVENAILRTVFCRDTTDENGNYFIETIAGENREIRIIADHYYDFHDVIDIDVGGNFFDFEITPLATLSGIITDSETDEPVEGAIITWKNHIDTTDAEGIYSLIDIVAGVDTLLIETEGYFEYQEDEFEIEDGNNEADFAIDILSGDLTGVVTDELTGESLFGATVTAIDPETQEIYRQVQTDDFGEYLAESLHDGVRYLVFAELNGYARSDTEQVLIRWNRDNEQDFELTPIFTRTVQQLQEEQDLETWISTSGIVTQGTNITDTEHTDIYIQDDSGWGISVYGEAPTDPENDINRGDEVAVTGFLVEMDGITTISNFEIDVISNGNPLPDPLIAGTGEMSMNDDREGTWAQISGRINRDPPDEGDYVLVVNDGSGQCDVRIFGSANLDLSDFSENDWGSFTGVIGLSRQGLRIIPNMQEDIERLNIYPPENLLLEHETIYSDTMKLAVTLTWEHERPDNFLRFKIYRDGEHIDNTTEISYIDTLVDPNPGEYETYSYTYGVSAVYEEGETDVVEIDLVFDVTTVIDRPYSGIPTEWALEAVYPNPFNPELSIIVALPQLSELDVRVFNILGKEAAHLANGSFVPGYHKFVLNAENLTSGIYFIHASVPEKMDLVRKVILIR
ncbi:FG-GAP-like repeat-containing protein [Calditrichota bacterium]